MANTPEGIDLTQLITEHDHVQGLATAPVTLVEYGDYECPYTRRAEPIRKAIQGRFGDRLRFVFRNFPLTQIHPHAQHAAEAAEAAAEQNKFWEMHDYLFAHQHALDDDHLAHYATVLGLDSSRFERELAAHTHAARIRADVEGGLQSGVGGTPTFFVNGVQYDGASDLEETILRAMGSAPNSDTRA